MISAGVLDALLADGATAEQIVNVVKAAIADDERALERRRNSDAERQRKHRLSRDVTLRNGGLSRDVTAVTVTEPPIKEHVRARVEGSSSSKEISGKKDNKPSARAELETVLDPEHAAAVIEHRQRKRCPMTARAAKMLAKQFAKASDPNAAADTMLARGWTGFEPEWLSNGKTANGKTDGEVLYKFSTAEEVMANLERQRKTHVG